MDLKKIIKDKTIIICENSYKEYILKELFKQNLFLDVTFYTKKTFFQEYFFSYNKEALYYVVNKYHVKPQIAQVYLDNLLLINESKDYSNFKLKFLTDLKKELLKNNLLIYNNEFKNYLHNYQVIVMGYGYLEKNELAIFSKIKAQIIPFNKVNEIPKVYKFTSITEEINFVCKKICSLINKGISVKNIKLMGVTKDYYNELDRSAEFYNLPIKIPTNNSLYSNSITQEFLSNYDTDLNKSLKTIKNRDSRIVSKIINVCNNYAFIEDKVKVKNLIVEDLKNIEISNYNYENYIEIIDLFANVTSDDYVFLLNFNMGIFPNIFKDEEYITDDLKDILELNTTIAKNKIIKENTKRRIESIANLTITFKEKDNRGECYPSILIEEMHLLTEEIHPNILESNSKINDKINYAKCLYNYEKYGKVTDDLLVYQNNLELIYNTFDNKFSGISKNLLQEYLDNHLTLSYSSLNNYNKCAFRYYIANILKLDKYEESFEAFIGSIFHHVLEKCFINKDLDVSNEINNYLKECAKELNLKEQFFVNKIIKDIEFVIKSLNEQQQYNSLDQALFEKKISIFPSTSIEFKGFIDKILYKEENNKTIISIIDYKTGNTSIDLKYLPYGLSLQLPIYLYLVQKSNLFVNPVFAGFYLQFILNKDITRNPSKSYENQYQENLKLVGYSNSEIHTLASFDCSYKSSVVIKSLKTKNNGDFYSSAKVLNNHEISKIIALTEKNIQESSKKILDGEFNINPKKIGFDKDVGCVYCKFKDLCFKKETDYIILQDIDNLDFLKEKV